MTNKYPEKLRLTLFKNQISEKNLKHLEGFSDKQLLEIMNATVLPNAMSINALKQTIMFHFIFMEKTDRKEKLIGEINKIVNFTKNLTKTEKVIIKYGVVKGFETRLWKKEFFLYLRTPLALKDNSTGRKIMSSLNFKEVFYFTYNLVKRGKNNDRLPRF